ncbi:MAG TPA: ABC transporter substrate-binding protein [Acidimicrobiales bacterium]|nr:ABC transporter substrate-binding protein [Acidimicrobiales bacterium]
MRRTWPSIGTGVLLAAVIAVGCGDDGDEAGSAGAGDGGLTGEPIVLGLISDGELASPPSPNLPTALAGAEAAAEVINADGGVNGRPIEIRECDTRADLNAASQCARELVGDGAVALVSAASQVSPGFLPVVEEAGIPSIGHFPVSEADYASEVTYPLVSGTPGLLIGQGVLVGELELERPSVVRINQDALAEAVALADMGLAATGADVVNEVEVPPQAPDMSSYVAAATADDTDSILAVMLPQDLVNFVSALRQSGSEVPVIASSNTVLDALSQGFGDDIEGVYAVGWMKPPTDTDDPAVQQFAEAMDALDPDAPKQDLSENSWASVHLFAEVATGLDTIDAASVTAALDQLEDYDSGLLPPVSFTEPQTLIPDLRLFNTSVLFTQVRDGMFVPLTGEFVDVFEAAASATG